MPGDVISSYEPGYTERSYQWLEDKLTPVLQRMGFSEYEARNRAAYPREALEFVLGPQSVEESGRRIGKQGVNLDTAGDVANIALSVPIPGLGVTTALGKKAVKRFVNRTAKRSGALGATARGVKRAKRYLTEPVGGKAEDIVRFSTKEDGPFRTVTPTRASPQIVPEAEKASLPELRQILSKRETNQPLRVADEYTQEMFGRPYDVETPDPTTSLEKQSGIGRAFQLGLEDPEGYKNALFQRYGEIMPDVLEREGIQNADQLLEASYRSLGREVGDQFSRLPIRMQYHFGAGEYGTPSEMLRDMLGRGNLNVFRGGERHPFLSEIDPETKLTQNEMFRAAHDYFGHGIKGTTFRPGGEEAAYASHAQMLSPLAQIALLAETRGQNSLVNYSPLNAELIGRMNAIKRELSDMASLDRMRGTPGASEAEAAPLRAQLQELGAQFQYAPQQPILLPAEYLPANSAGGLPEYVRQFVVPRAPTGPERAVHLSHTAGLTRTDPAFYGTGHRGDDWRVRGRRGSPAQHTSFYIGPTGLVVPEKYVEDVSPFAYETELSGLYDIGEDPEGLVALAKAYNLGPNDTAIPDFTRLAREYGYKGYREPNFGPQAAANVFEPVENLAPITKGEKGYANGGLV